MRSRSKKRILGLIGALALVLTAIPAAAAGGPADMSIGADVYFAGEGIFESNLPGCTTGEIGLEFTAGEPILPKDGVTHRVIVYSFSCDGGGGFVIRMIATFGADYGPATAHWRVTSSEGPMAGLHARGTVEDHGTPSGDYDINDIYTGTYHFAPPR
jgi:hypothetical protein